MSGPRPWAETPTGIVLRLRVKPKARREGVEGVVADPEGRPLLAVAVTAPPAEGAANRAVTSVLARALGVAKSVVTIDAGASSRVKTVAIAGDAEVLATRLAGLLGP